jgi:hypothetical protein
VIIAPGHPELEAPPPLATAAPGRMEIVLGNGRRIIVDTSVRAAALACVIKVLDRR